MTVLTEHLDRPFDFAVLKGRSNYACRQRVHEATTSDGQGTLDGTRDTTVDDELRARGHAALPRLLSIRSATSPGIAACAAASTMRSSSLRLGVPRM